MKLRAGAVACLLIAAAASLASAGNLARNQLLRFTGTLLDPDGRPLAGDQTLVFQIFEGRGGEPIWEERHPVTMENGRYTVLLGAQTRIDIPLNRDSYLFVQPEGLDDVIEQYRIVVASGDPGAEPGAHKGQRGVYRLEAAGSRNGTAARGKEKAVDTDDDAADAEETRIAATGFKLRTIKQVVSPNGTILFNPGPGTPDPLVVPFPGRLEIDVNPAILSGAGATGPTGATGPVGATGAMGATGPPGPKQVLECTTLNGPATDVLPRNGFFLQSPSCDTASGYVTTGGGCNMVGIAEPFVWWQNGPSGGEGWICRGFNSHATATASVIPYTRCCRVP
jgi:hypothetical protein